MSCINHPEIPVSSYCQSCGRPLCAECVRSVQGMVFCENCLAARLGMPARPGAAPGPLPGPVPGTIPDPNPAAHQGAPSPSIAALLGFIPGVGAMYNGQFAKALVHVVVFAVLVGLAGHNGIFGIFIGAWVLYQVFDASHTARARRDGLPMPDPLGLNELGNRMGMPTAAYGPPSPGTPFSGGPAAGFVPGAPPPSSYTAPFTSSTPSPEAPPYASGYPPAPPPTHRSEPIGAIVLIAVGMLFLFSTLGIFRFDWIGEGWPVIVILIGIWLLVRRTRGMQPPAGGV